MNIQEQIEQMKEVIANLEGLGDTLTQSEIDSMKQKLAGLEAKLVLEFEEAEAKTASGAQVVVKEVKAEVEAEVSNFWVKYRVELIVATLLVISHIASKCGM